jgi:TP901 family phage tail tape measure protein
MALADTAELAVRLTLDDRFSRGVDRSLKKLGSLEGRVSKVGQNLQRLGAVGFTAIGAGLVGSLKVAGDFEAQLNTINTVARATPEVLGEIGKGIRELARDTGTGLDELTAGYYDLVSAGVAAADAQGVLKAANTLAIGGLATTAETVDLLTTAINTYGLEAKEAGKVSDIFAKAIERGKVTAAELAQSFAQVGPIAAASGIELEELGAAYAQLTASGVPAAEAATQVRSAIVALTKRTGDLEKLEKQTGRSYLSIAGKKGLVVALEQMRKDAAKAGVPLIDLLGRVEGLNFTLATTGTNFADYNEDLEAMGKASGTAAAQMGERQKGLNFQLARLKALAKDAGISIGSALIPKLVPLIEKLNTFITQNQGKIEKFAGDLAKGFEQFGEAVGKVDFKSIGEGLRITGQAAKVAVDAFLSLPPDIQKLAIAALAVNKLTGGIPGALAVKGIEALLGGLKTIIAGNVTVVGKTIAGVPGATPTPAPGTTAKATIGTFIKGALAVSVVSMAGTVLAQLGQSAVSDATRDFLAKQPTAAQIKDAIEGLKVARRGATLNIGGFDTGLDLFGQAASLDARIAELEAALDDLGAAAETATAGLRTRANSPLGSKTSAADARFRELADMRDSLRTIVENTARTPTAIDNFRKAQEKVGTGSVFQAIQKAIDKPSASILPVVQNLVHSFQKGDSPWARDLSAMRGHLAGLKDLEKAFRDAGQTDLADAVGAEIAKLGGHIDKLKPPKPPVLGPPLPTKADPALKNAITTGFSSETAAIARAQAAQVAAVNASKAAIAAGFSSEAAAISRAQAAQVAAVNASKASLTTGISGVAAKIVALVPGLGPKFSGIQNAVNGVKGAAQGTTAAVNRKDLSVQVTANTTVTTNVSVRDLGVNTSRKSRFGYSHV